MAAARPRQRFNVYAPASLGEGDDRRRRGGGVQEVGEEHLLSRPAGRGHDRREAPGHHDDHRRRDRGRDAEGGKEEYAAPIRTPRPRAAPGRPRSLAARRGEDGGPAWSAQAERTSGRAAAAGRPRRSRSDPTASTGWPATARGGGSAGSPGRPAGARTGEEDDDAARPRRGAYDAHRGGDRGTEEPRMRVRASAILTRSPPRAGTNAAPCRRCRHRRFRGAARADPGRRREDVAPASERGRCSPGGRGARPRRTAGRRRRTPRDGGRRRHA